MVMEEVNLTNKAMQLALTIVKAAEEEILLENVSVIKNDDQLTVNEQQSIEDHLSKEQDKLQIESSISIVSKNSNLFLKLCDTDKSFKKIETQKDAIEKDLGKVVYPKQSSATLSVIETALSGSLCKVIKTVPSHHDFTDQLCYEKYLYKHQRDKEKKFDINHLPNAFVIPKEILNNTCQLNTVNSNESLSYLLMPEGSEVVQLSLYSPLPFLEFTCETLQDDIICPNSTLGLDATPPKTSHVMLKATKKVRFSSPISSVKEFVKDITYVSSDEEEFDETLPIPYKEEQPCYLYYNEDIDEKDDINLSKEAICEQVVPSFHTKDEEMNTSSSFKANTDNFNTFALGIKKRAYTSSPIILSDVESPAMISLDSPSLTDDCNLLQNITSPNITYENVTRQSLSPLKKKLKTENIGSPDITESMDSPDITENMVSPVITENMVSPDITEPILDGHPLDVTLQLNDVAMFIFYHSYVTACYKFSELLVSQLNVINSSMRSASIESQSELMEVIYSGSTELALVSNPRHRQNHLNMDEVGDFDPCIHESVGKVLHTAKKDMNENTQVDEMMLELMLSQAVRSDGTTNSNIKHSHITPNLKHPQRKKRKRTSEDNVVPDLNTMHLESEDELSNSIFLHNDEGNARREQTGRYESSSVFPSRDDSVVPNASFMYPSQIICTPQKVRLGLSKKVRSKSRLHPYHKEELT